MAKWQNTPHSSAIKERISAESLLKLHQLREKLVKTTTA